MGVGFGVVDLDDPIAVVIKGAGVEEFVFRVPLAAPAVLLTEVFVGESPLRVVVAPAIPGVAGKGVQIPPVVLHVLTMVGLGPGQAVWPLLQDGITAIPQRQAQAQPLLHVTEAR